MVLSVSHHAFCTDSPTGRKPLVSISHDNNDRIKRSYQLEEGAMGGGQEGQLGGDGEGKREGESDVIICQLKTYFKN